MTTLESTENNIAMILPSDVVERTMDCLESVRDTSPSVDDSEDLHRLDIKLGGYLNDSLANPQKELSLTLDDWKLVRSAVGRHMNSLPDPRNPQILERLMGDWSRFDELYRKHVPAPTPISYHPDRDFLC